MTWNNQTGLKPYRYKCGHCENLVASNQGYGGSVPREYGQRYEGFVYICPNCERPTFLACFGNAIREKFPAASFGDSVGHLPDEVKELYDEARRCMKAGAYTAAVMVCRKLLMHIAVEKGGDENENFAYYVDWLQENHFIPPDGKSWVDRVRTKGNAANHEILLMKQEEAEELITFLAMLMKFIYEFPLSIAKRENPEQSS